MLVSLKVRDFAIVDEIDVEFGPGLTVLTGETGAGKSILVDAIGLVLGERGGSQVVRDGAKRAEFSAEFDVSSQAAAQSWLRDQALDEDSACLLRRVVNADGRSRAFINGQAVTVAQLKALGELLLDIHGQHFHQSLARRPVQRDLLDYFGSLADHRQATEAAFESWRALSEQLHTLVKADKDRASRLDLVAFQLEELDALALGEDELSELSSERQRLRHSGRLAEGVSTALDRLAGGDVENANSLVAAAARSIEAIQEFDPALRDPLELLETANIQITEAADSLERYTATLEMDPAHRDQVEERLDAIHAIARKHRIEPGQLPKLTQALRRELDDLNTAEARGEALESETREAWTTYLEHAGTLSAERHTAAGTFSAAVTDAMDGLGMPGGRFVVDITPLDEDAARPWGLDSIEFLISANPGQAPMPLSRVASGGELSRMSLAIQVIASDGSAIPTMVFDEVDSGVGGRVAEMVGRRLQELGADRQVLCVTHLPQVASLADHHFRVSKVTDGKITRTRVADLGPDERVQEVARMLGGVEITQTTLDHAAEMLAGGKRRKRA